MGKRGGVIIIYFNGGDGRVGLLIADTKSRFGNFPTAFLAKLKTGGRTWIKKRNNSRKIYSSQFDK
jgi:hypothetical protein